MALTARDLRRFVGRWVVLQVGTGSLEGELAELTKTAVRLHPVMVTIRGLLEIGDYSVVAALQDVTVVRECSRAVAEQVIAEIRQVQTRPEAEIKPAPAVQGQGGRYL